MLSIAELKTVQKYLKIYCSSHVVPFDWDWDPVNISERLRGTISRPKLIITTVAIAVTAVILGHEVFALMQYLDPEVNVSPETACMHVLLMGWRLLVILMHVNSFIYKEEIALLYNQVVNFNVDIFDDELRSERKVRHLLLRWYMPGMSCVGVVAALLFVFMNHEPFYIYNSLKKFFPMEGPVYLGIFGLFDAILNSYFGCIASQVAFCVQIAYMVNNKSWLRVVGCEWPSSALKISSRARRFRFITRGINYYRRLQLLNSLYNQCHAKFLIPGMKTICVGLAIQTTYSTLRYATVFHPVYTMQFTNLATFYIMLVVAFCGTTSYFVSLSSSVRRFSLATVNLKDSERRLCMRAIRSCKPIAFQVGGFYCMKRKTTIMILNAFLNGTFSLLITF